MNCISGVNGKLRYTILTSGVPFTIGEFDGIVSTSGQLDRESDDSYLLTVQAADVTNSPLTSTAQV